MCLAFFKSLFAKKAAPEMVAPFLTVLSGGMAGSPGAAGADVLLYAFDRLNTSGSSTDSNHLFPVLCDRGDVPSGSTLVITDSSDVDVAAGICNRVLWDDGSLKMAHVALRATVAGSGTHSLKAKSRPSSSYDDTDPATDLATLLATGDWKVEFSSVTETDTAGTRTHASGDMLAKATDYGANTGRIRKLIANPFVERWQVWAYVKGGSTGAGSADAHFKVYWYITRWRNSNGTQHSLFITPVMALEEVYVATKKRLNYTATFKDGSTTLETYTSVQHPYRSTWAAVRQDNDAIHARAKCVAGSADCWLIVRPDKDYWQAAECFLPMDPAFTPTAESLTADNSTFTACYNQGHRANIDDGGGYGGRGLMTQFDARAFMTPTANHARIGRVCAHAGLHIPYHYRPAYGSNDPATLLPLILDNASGAGDPNEWNSDGMPDAVYMSIDDRTNSFDYDYVPPEGGNGVWTPSGDTSHAVAYSGFQWVIEGEEYFNQANLDLMIATSVNLVGDVYGNHRALMWSGVGGGFSGFSGLGIPTTQWSSLIDFQQQERSLGWALAILSWAVGFHPAGRIESNFLADFATHQASYMEQSLSYAPASMESCGAWIVREDGFGSAWMQNFGSMMAVWIKRNLRHQGWVDLAAQMGNFTVALWDRSNRICSNSYRGWYATKPSGYNVSTNPFIVHHLFEIDCTYDVSANTFLTGTFDTDNANALKDNDKVYFAGLTTGGSTSTPPGNTAVGTEYFVINRSAPTSTTTQFQISLTQGGSAVDLTGSNGSASLFCDLLSADGGSGSATDPGGSGYNRIAYAALVMHNVDGHAGATDTLVDDVEDYMSSQSWAGDPGFKPARI